MSPSCTLVVLFNHPFPKNIDKLRAIYGDRFDDIVFLMPIVTVNDPAVITVFRGGYNFHGQVADALAMLEARKNDLYLFCQDDLLLNPALTPANFWRNAHFDRYDGFLPEPESFSGPGREHWPWNDRVLSRITEPTSVLYGGGVEAFTHYLPPVEEARLRFARYGITSETAPKPWSPEPSPVRGGLLGRVTRGPALTKPLPYPLAVAFSDFFALRRDALQPVAQYFGLFAAMDLFVEVSVATAMILGCKNLCRLGDTPWQVQVDWTDRRELAKRAPQTLASAYQSFSDTLLYSHPVKLSSILLDPALKADRQGL